MKGLPLPMCFRETSKVPACILKLTKHPSQLYLNSSVLLMAVAGSLSQLILTHNSMLQAHDLQARIFVHSCMGQVTGAVVRELQKVMYI